MTTSGMALCASARAPSSLSSSRTVEQKAYKETYCRGSEADDQHLTAALAPIPRQRFPRIDTHRKQRHRAQSQRDNDCWRLREHRERGKRYEVSDKGRNPHDTRASQKRGGLKRLYVELLFQHRPYPNLAVRGDRVHHLIKQFAIKAFCLINVPNFMPFLLRNAFDFLLLP